MHSSPPEKYLQFVYQEIPRVLTLLDRNSFSPTYGCFHRSYWFHRTSDFPTAISQMGVQTLALLWANPLKDNPYYNNPKILKWCLAGIRYWMTLQKSDGSFDEWYPNERGWAGPTGYLVHAMADSYFRLGAAFPDEMQKSFKRCISRAARYLVAYDEKYVLANHHAIALLPIYEAFKITGEEKLLEGFHIRFEEFQTYCFPEGWCLEYDGVDIGYLSGTISFLSRLHHHWPEEKLEKIIRRAIDFTSYFLYPDGYFGGNIGSRQTVHFYHYGYEFWSGKNDLAARMAETGLNHLDIDQLVAPGAMEDHYVLYRLPELIEAYLEWKPRPEALPPLPWEKKVLEKEFSSAGIVLRKIRDRYLVVNLNRGGIVKYYDTAAKKMIHNDSGWFAQLEDGKVVTSVWNDPDYKVDVGDHEFRVEGRGNYFVTKRFTPLKLVIFRIFMMVFGWNSFLAYKIKGLIRRLMMVGQRRAPVFFQRTVSFDQGRLEIKDSIRLEAKLKIKKMEYGGEFFVRYVPQSRYFQKIDLEDHSRSLSKEQLEELNETGELMMTAVFE